MNRLFTIITLLTLSCMANAQVSIHSIQYTTNSYDGSYPSPYEGQYVSTGGIVTATNYLGNRFFISSSQGGAWNGIFVYDNNYSPEIGDSVQIYGLVYEYQGYTEIKDLSSYNVVSSGNALPPAADISTSEVNSEAYEGVLIALNDCEVSMTFDSYGNWMVNDGSGHCELSNGIFELRNENFPLFEDYSFERIEGVIGINYSQKKVHPRGIEDLKSAEGNFIVSTDDQLITKAADFKLPIKIFMLNQQGSLTNYSLQLEYNPAVLSYVGYELENTISAAGTLTETASSGQITLNYSGLSNYETVDTLINLIFSPQNEGAAELSFTSATFDGTDHPYVLAGDLEYRSSECSVPIADTLTVIQGPILNIPTLAIEGEEIDIICFAPENTTSWSADLLYRDLIVPLEITQSDYKAEGDRWVLKARIPTIELYELYDLRVAASGNLTDTVVNAVKVLDRYKEDYYFAHITDTHLPNHRFYGDDGYNTDSTELDDLYEVIKDINLLNPEFVLMTGDLINEGELEDFECLRNHTMTVNLLEQFEVPVYIVPGNHDLGGWTATPPSQGTARREWWRFFGWRQQSNPGADSPYLSRDYSFDYGDTHFTGLEAYDNYDSYMYDIYGGESFTSQQIDWLKQDLAAAGDMTKVLFYHFDFKNELNLSALGVDMALWGHNHRNTGDIYNYPASLSTASVCDENRAIRFVRVSDGNLQAENTVYTHWAGDMLRVQLNTVNDGSLDSLSATVRNNYQLDFGHGLLKFKMPHCDQGYEVENGELKQILKEEDYSICYVEVQISASSQEEVSIKTRPLNTGVREYLSAPSSYPNPFAESCYISYELKTRAFVSIDIYSMDGRHIKTLQQETQHPGRYQFTWDASNAEGTKVQSGTYIYSISLDGVQRSVGRLVFLGE